MTFLWYPRLSGPRVGVPGQPGSLDLAVALGHISAQEVLMRRQRMMTDTDGVYMTE